MNPEAAALLVAVLALIVAVITLWAWMDRRRHKAGPDVGAAIFEPPVDEDINAPRLEVIEAALMLTTDPGGRDYLLDRWLAAKEKAS